MLSGLMSKTLSEVKVGFLLIVSGENGVCGFMNKNLEEMKKQVR